MRGFEDLIPDLHQVEQFVQELFINGEKNEEKKRFNDKIKSGLSNCYVLREILQENQVAHQHQEVLGRDLGVEGQATDIGGHFQQFERQKEDLPVFYN